MGTFLYSSPCCMNTSSKAKKLRLGMSFFTKYDDDNVTLYAQHQGVVNRRNTVIVTAPHIATHTNLTVKACSDEYDITDPIYTTASDNNQREARRDLQNTAIVTCWTFTKVGCDNVISCNPFYPKEKRCSGMVTFALGGDGGVTSEGTPEASFSFQTLNGQSFDVCQPPCYDSGVKQYNMFGLTTVTTFDVCRVQDPLILAFYVDPSRRYVDPDKQILENKAFIVKHVKMGSNNDVGLLAKIPPDYCVQYGETIKPDGQLHGIDMFKCKDHPLVWSTSWLLGDTLPKLTLLAKEKLLSDKKFEEETRYPPSCLFLASRETWLKNIAPGKCRLPFPLRLSDLGIQLGTTTEWLIWTDEFSHLTDGRNDVYGGRLVERDRPVNPSVRLRDRTATARAMFVNRNITAGGRFGSTDQTTHETRRVTRQTILSNDDAEEKLETDLPDHALPDDGHLRSMMLKMLEQGAVEYHRVLSKGVEPVEVDLKGLAAGFAYGATYEYASRKLHFPRISGVLKSATFAIRNAPGYVKSVSLKAIGSWAAKSTSVRATSATFIKSLAHRFKSLAFAQALGPFAVVIDVISLIGMAIDIVFVALNAFGVSTSTGRRENFVSDRRLYQLAQTEIEFNYRMYGVGNIEMTPFQFFADTPYVTSDEDFQSYMAVMPIVYTARKLNNNGGRLRPDRLEDGDFQLDRVGKIHYVKNGIRRATINDDGDISSAADEILQSTLSHTPRCETEHSRINQSSNLTSYYVSVLIIVSCLIGYFYPSKRWTIVVALLLSILCVVFPTVSQPRASAAKVDPITKF